MLFTAEGAAGVSSSSSSSSPSLGPAVVESKHQILTPVFGTLGEFTTGVVFGLNSDFNVFYRSQCPGTPASQC